MPKGIKGFQKRHKFFGDLSKSNYFKKDVPNNVRENNPMWRGGKKDITCLHCERIFKGYKQKYCSLQCANRYFKKREMLSAMLTSRKGEKSPNWQGGKSFELYPLGWTRTFREQIRRRDQYRCQLCGIPEAECNRRLHVHHIDYNKMNINPNNLLSLCLRCHCKTNVNRKRWKMLWKK